MENIYKHGNEVALRRMAKFLPAEEAASRAEALNSKLSKCIEGDREDRGANSTSRSWRSKLRRV